MENREQWTAIKLAIGDSQNFRDLLSALHWEEGLTIEAVNLIQSHLVTSSGSDDTQRQSVAEGTTTRQPRVSFNAARHAAEVVGVLFKFAVGMVEYTAVYKTHWLAADKLRRLVVIVLVYSTCTLQDHPVAECMFNQVSLRFQV